MVKVLLNKQLVGSCNKIYKLLQLFQTISKFKHCSGFYREFGILKKNHHELNHDMDFPITEPGCLNLCFQ